MADLVKIQTTDNMEQVVSARELHEKLGIRERFSLWFERIQKTLSLNEGIDYCRHTYTNANNQTFPDYLIPIDIAKHICMISGGERAHIIRQYFIEVEKAWNSPEMVMSRALKLAERKIMSLEKERQALLPKAEQFDKFISGENYQDMNTVAKVLGWGRNNLFKELRNRKILMSDNRPYQRYIDAGYFVVKEKPIHMGGQVINKPQTYVTAKGVSWLEKILSKEGVLV